jgi:hypothetical protein
MRKSMHVMFFLGVLGLVFGISSSFTRTAGAFGHSFGAGQIYKVWGNGESCAGDCRYASDVICCQEGDHILGGGPELNVGEPGNTNAGDNVYIQNSFAFPSEECITVPAGPGSVSITTLPEDGSGCWCWFVDASEAQNNPGAGGTCYDGTGSCAQEPRFTDYSCDGGSDGNRPAYCFFNWNSSSMEVDPTTSATSTEWTITAHAVCSSD